MFMDKDKSIESIEDELLVNHKQQRQVMGSLEDMLLGLRNLLELDAEDKHLGHHLVAFGKHLGDILVVDLE